MTTLQYTLVINWNKRLISVALFLLLAALAACGGAGAEVVEEAPPRRGSINVLGIVQGITAEVLEVSAADVGEDSQFRADLGADDAEIAELVERLEEEFGIEISDEEATNLTTIQSAVELIESKR